MKRRNPTREQIQAAMEFQDVRPRTSRTWVIHWLTIPPTIRRYKEPVMLSRVLSEHHAAIAAEPVGD